ncbi:MAG: hypothetical protein KAI73_10975 [Rhodospirillaceae bacterium]|nr:hypothetical protein [Rhodospirillaceae bacterium]
MYYKKRLIENIVDLFEYYGSTRAQARERLNLMAEMRTWSISRLESVWFELLESDRMDY